jgi:glycopeptide antibiotics resistance protein
VCLCLCVCLCVCVYVCVGVWVCVCKWLKENKIGSRTINTQRCVLFLNHPLAFSRSRILGSTVV